MSVMRQESNDDYDVYQQDDVYDNCWYVIVCWYISVWQCEPTDVSSLTVLTSISSRFSEQVRLGYRIFIHDL